MNLKISLLLALLFACGQGQQKNTLRKEPQSRTVKVQALKNPYSKSKFVVKTFYTEKSGFGYEIFMDGAKIIQQPHIPGIAGNRGFQTAKKAKKAAELIISKIRRNQMPPSASVAELDSLGLLR